MTPYGGLTKADAYLGDRLGTDWWFESTIEDRNKALIMATRAIDRLNFAGVKADVAQELQFPRGNDTVVPEGIELACFEIAFQYICGTTIEDEIKGFGVDSFQISGARSSMTSQYAPEHLRAGIVSAEAWMYLRPFLRDPYCFSLSRG